RFSPMCACAVVLCGVCVCVCVCTVILLPGVDVVEAEGGGGLVDVQHLARAPAHHVEPGEADTDQRIFFYTSPVGGGGVVSCTWRCPLRATPWHRLRTCATAASGHRSTAATPATKNEEEERKREE